MEKLYKNPNLTMEIIEQHHDNHWNWVAISENPNITIEIHNNSNGKYSYIQYMNIHSPKKDGKFNDIFPVYIL